MRPLGDRCAQEEQSVCTSGSGPCSTLTGCGGHVTSWGLGFLSRKMTAFSSLILFWPHLPLNCWRHTVKTPEGMGKVGNTEPGRNQGAVMLVTHHSNSQQSTARVEICRGSDTLAVKKATYGHWGKDPQQIPRLNLSSMPPCGSPSRPPRPPSLHLSERKEPTFFALL